MPAKTKVTMGGAKPAVEEPEVVEEVVEEPVETVPDVEDVADEPEAEEPPKSIEDLDPAEELWDGGPTIGQIQAWKEEYGDVFVTSISLDHHVVWRTLRRPEYTAHVKNMEHLISTGQLTQAEANMYNEEVIAELCMLYPVYDEIEAQTGLAGIPSLISQQINEASGFMAVEVRQL